MCREGAAYLTMKIWLLHGFTLWLCFGLIGVCHADLPPKVVAHCKQATASVFVGEKASGTAFYIGHRLFITNAHVVELADQSHKITLVLGAGERTQETLSTTLLRANQKLDFALLRAGEGKLPSALELGDASSIIETLTVAAFGYPFGSELTGGKSDYPAVSVNLGHITSLPSKAGEIQLIRMDTPVNPGVSGGPLVNVAGQVLGVIAADPDAKDVNVAIPVDQLRRFLYGPLPKSPMAQKGRLPAGRAALQVLVTPQPTDEEEPASPELDLRMNIQGVVYKPTGTREKMKALFSQPDGGVSTFSYSGYILVEVSGFGVSYGKDAPNDAFYLFNNAAFSTPKNGHDGGFYQLTFGTDTLTSRSLGSNATHFLVGPVPPYNPAHKYSFILNTRLTQPGRLHFGVSDGGYDGNEGVYIIKLTQLVPVR